MSVLGIASSSIFQYLNSQSTQSNFQNFKQEFQQLGKDLQSGNLSQAQADFAALQPNNVQAVASGTQTSASPIAIAFQQLSSDLQSGNLSAAQQDYSTIQQDMRQHSAAVSGHHLHHHHPSGGPQGPSGSQNALDQLFSQLGQALQTGSLTNAQSAYASLQQEFAQLGAVSSSSSSSSTSSSNPLNVTV